MTAVDRDRLRIARQGHELLQEGRNFERDREREERWIIERVREYET
jgi:hypothetical protein